VGEPTYQRRSRIIPSATDQALELSCDEQRRLPADDRQFAADEVLPVSRGCSLRFYRHPGAIRGTSSSRKIGLANAPRDPSSRFPRSERGGCGSRRDPRYPCISAVRAELVRLSRTRSGGWFDIGSEGVIA